MTATVTHPPTTPQPSAPTPARNSIHVIFPIREGGIWHFTDPSVGLCREPFVASAGAVIERLCAGIPDAASGIALLFSAGEFPGATRLTHVRHADGGDWYALEDGTECWLCPALRCYYPDAPAELWVQAIARAEGGAS